MTSIVNEVLSLGAELATRICPPIIMGLFLKLFPVALVEEAISFVQIAGEMVQAVCMVIILVLTMGRGWYMSTTWKSFFKQVWEHALMVLHLIFWSYWIKFVSSSIHIVGVELVFSIIVWNTWCSCKIK